MFPVEHVLLPTLKEMGANIDLNILGYGFFPDVKGKVEATITAVQEPLKAIKLLSRGAKDPK